MGYYTNYSLTFEPPDAPVWPILNENRQARFALGKDGLGGDQGSWYEHEEHLIELSKALPGVTLHLSGEGEEACDIWVKDFRNGLIQVRRAKVVIPDFVENLWQVWPLPEEEE